MIRLRLFLPTLLAATALLVAACGGDDSDGQEAASTTDANELLTQTFTGDKKIDSGKVDASLSVDASGGSEGQQKVTMNLSGPFQSTGADTLPKLQLAFGLDGGGQSIDAGVTSTGEKAYVAFQGEDYAVSDQVFNQFKTAYEQAAAKSQESGQGQSLATLGMDPRKWLTDPRNAGEEKVGDDDTIKITGGVDVDALLDDINTALGKVGELGLSGAGQVPDKITEAQKRQVIDAVKDPRVEIYTGKEDKILRRMVVDVGVEDAESKTSGKFAVDMAITELNEDQEITEPSGAKPFNELLGKLGALGGLAGGTVQQGSGSSSGSSGAGSSEDLQKYSDCVSKAGSDVEKARKCADLLTG